MKYLLGKCNVCGNEVNFTYEDDSLWRETLFCSECKSPSRYRSIAMGIIRAVDDITGIRVDSVNDFCNKDFPRQLDVYDTQCAFYSDHCAYPLPDLLKKSGNFSVKTSKFIQGTLLGSLIGDDVTNQNLEALTFKDESFDIVITSDVMEHVRLDELAHKEIARVLKKNGIYIFTVPHGRGINNNLIRVAIPDPEDKSKDQFIMEPEYHGDVNGDGGGALSYRVYGLELDEMLYRAGFDVKYNFFNDYKNCILNTELFYCIKK
jgi:SAM-dependent methyltransferase